jgi:hypothetical protein
VNANNIIPPFGDFGGYKWTLENELVHGNNCETPTPTGKLKIVKEVLGGDSSPADWTMSATASGNEFDFQDSGDSETFHTVEAGLVYAMSESGVEESGPDGYTLTAISCVGNTALQQAGQGWNDITLAENDKVTCTFTNTYNSYEPSTSITVVKNIGDIKNETEFDFTFHFNDFDDSYDFGLLGGDQITFDELDEDEQLIIEHTKAGWELSEIVCESSDGYDSDFRYIYSDNETSFFDGVEVNIEEGDQVTCTFYNDKEEEPVATIIATKIVCDEESLLPNDGYSSIDANTVAGFLLSTPERAAGCRVEPDFAFQWAVNGQDVQIDNEGAQGGPWVTADPTDVNGQTVISIDSETLGGGKTISVREVMNTDDYIPFTGRNSDQNVSAELYCASDASNYDNLEWISDVTVENEYYCVAWNVEVEKFSDVTMCKYDEKENPLEGWSLMLQGDEVAEYEVPANSAAGIDTASLQAGVSHIVIAEGTWDNNRGPLNIVDAEYSTEDGWLSSIMDGFTSYGTEILELFIGGNGGDWGPYNSLHHYAQAFVPGVTGPVNLAINDTYYVDNTGSLAVTVGTGYVGVTEENGCVTFNDVPFGDYQTEELTQDGWINLSGLGQVTVDEEVETFNVVNRDVSQTPVATIVAEKIVCTDEAEVPNQEDWSTLRPISANTAQTWVDEHDSCDFASGWEFQWGPQSSFDPGDIATGTAGEPWITFGPTVDGKVTLALSEKELGDSENLWFREVLQDGYIPFTHDQNGEQNTDNYSAAAFCATDVLNYDNYERIDQISVGNTYHCIAWNVPKELPSPELPPVTSCSYVSNLAINDTVSQENVDENLTSFTLNDLTYGSGDEFDLFVSGDTAANGPFNDEVVVERTVDGLELFFYGTGSSGPVKEFSGSFTLNGVDLTNAIIAVGAATNETTGNWPDTFTLNQTTGEVTFTLYTTSGNDSFVITGLTENCLPPVDPQTYRISGFKWDDANGNGEYDLTTENSQVGEPTLEGWEITLFDNNNNAVATTATDGTGNYFFDVAPGTWTVMEETVPGWTQTALVKNGVLVPTDNSEFGDSCTFIVPGENQSAFFTCSFGNQEDPETIDTETAPEQRAAGGSSGTRILRVAAPTPLVLGATTDAPQFCPSLLDYMQMGTDNDRIEVMKLQMFLNIFRNLFGGTENPVTGNFGIITDTNVKKFQEFYKDEILQPWFDEGIVGHTKPTGFVYMTTLWKINSIVCPDLAVLPDLTGETLQTNIDMNARAEQD